MRDWLLSVAPGHRWFADKERTATDVSIKWRSKLSPSSNIELLVAEFQFEVGPPSLYFIPFDVMATDDATSSQGFTLWLMRSLKEANLLPEGMRWSHLGTHTAIESFAEVGQVLDVEQSNTSIRYGERTLIKVNRRLAIGPSPEAELASVIAKAADPSFAARTFGVMTLSGVAPEPLSIATCSEFVRNIGDGWEYLLGLLDDPADVDGVVAREVEQIASVTAAMHLGLTSDPWRSDVAPEPITIRDIERWEATSIRALESLERKLVDTKHPLDPRAQELAHLLPSAAPILRDQLRGFRALRGTQRIRIHGDYHLAQLLRTPSGAYVVVDFDGEPNRPLSERRDKYSPLRDVAGMLRSFAYARGTAEKIYRTEGTASLWLDWERRSRDQFLHTYVERMAGQPISLIPNSGENVRLALGALELEKAIYECGYELSNRPDWLWLPLSRLVRAG